MSKQALGNCATCGKPITDYATQRIGRHVYCCRECADKAKRTRFTIECRWCGKPFEITPSQYLNGYRLCSWACRLAEKVDATKRICEICGAPFTVRAPCIQKRTCSRKCSDLLRRRGEYRICETCGKRFWAMPNAFDHARFCSRACKDTGHGKDISGPKHPNWRGGTAYAPYPFGWTEDYKASIIARDGRRCRECGSVDELAVHHIDYAKENLDPSNLITLCNTCHGRTNYHREHWRERYTDMLAA